MTSDFPSLLSADIVQLQAQGGESKFYVHANILVSQSKPFRDALSGSWKEATERIIDLQDWDSDTVGRMVEFLYRQRYQYPNPVAISPTNATSVVASGTLNSMSWTTSAVTELARLRTFDPLQYDYGDILLAHARVYQLAHYRAIDPLKVLALGYLQQTLLRIHPVGPATGSHTIGHIIELTRKVYENTDHLENDEEPLRGLISSFITENFSALRSHPDLARLFYGGDIVVDVMGKLSKKLSVSSPFPHLVTRSRPTRYVSKLVGISATPGWIPHDHIREINGASADLNWSCNGCSSFWIYAEFTLDPSTACTGFSVCLNGRWGPDKVNVAGSRFIYQERDKDVKKKVTAVALLRLPDYIADVADIPIQHDTYDGMTDDLNSGRPGDYLYIVWKSAVVT